MNEIIKPNETIESGLPAEYLGAQASLAVSLARAEIDQQIATARALPRSISKAMSEITTLATLDEETAAECIYALPRGGKTIRGPSIRFAEIMVSQWGNARVGARVVHVDRIEGYVEAEGVFHDLQTNVAQTARVRRQIQAKRGKGIDSDMIQLAGAAACSIARRNAILAGIPKGVARKAYQAVEDIIRGDAKPIAERRTLALRAFAQLGVTAERLFLALGVAGESDLTIDHLITLTGVRSAIKNGETTIDEAFPEIRPAGPAPKTLGDRLEALTKGANAETGEIAPAAETVQEQATGADQRRGATAEDQPAAAKGAGGAVSSSAANPAPTSKDAAQGRQDARETAPKADKAPKADAKPAELDRAARRALILEDLTKQGESAARRGRNALDAFLDRLDGDENAMLSPALQKGWRAIAKDADAKGPPPAEDDIPFDDAADERG